MNGKNETIAQRLFPHRNLPSGTARTCTKRKQAWTKSTAAIFGTAKNISMDINSFMPGNQSFNRSLYAPLPPVPLVCTPAVYFKRKVYMKRRPILRRILSAGVAVHLALLLFCATLHAQSTGLVP